jgi:hypothetical protein
MRLIAGSTVCLVLPLLAGCYDAGGSYAAPSSAAPSYRDYPPTGPSIVNDSYSPTIKVKTESGQRGGPASSGTEIYGLYATVDRKSGAVVSYVQWGEVYGDRSWRFYSRASTDKAEPLSVDQVDRSVGRCFPNLGECTYSEVYNIKIPEKLMKAGAADGIRFKIYGRNGDERIVMIPAMTVAPFNEKVAEAVKLRSASPGALPASSRTPIPGLIICSFPGSPNPHLARVEMAASSCTGSGGTILGPAS